MATKAEQAKARAQRNANPPKPKRAARPRRDDPVDTSQPGVSATDRKAGAGSTAKRNASERVAKKTGAALEDSATERPSRKSTRKSSGRAKRTTNLALRETRAARAPKTRAIKAEAAKPSAKPKPAANAKPAAKAKPAASTKPAAQAKAPAKTKAPAKVAPPKKPSKPAARAKK